MAKEGFMETFENPAGTWRGFRSRLEGNGVDFLKKE